MKKRTPAVKPDVEPDDLIDLKEAAKLSLDYPQGLRYRPGTLRVLIGRQVLRHWKRHNATFVSRAEVTAFYARAAKVREGLSVTAAGLPGEDVPEDLVNLDEAIAILGPNPETGRPFKRLTVTRWVEEGLLPGWTTGPQGTQRVRHVSVSRLDLELFAGIARVPIELDATAAKRAARARQAAAERKADGQDVPFPPDLISLREAAALLPGKLQAGTLRCWIKEGWLPAYETLGRRRWVWVVSRQELFDYVGPRRVPIRLRPEVEARIAAEERARHTDEVLRRVGMRK